MIDQFHIQNDERMNLDNEKLRLILLDAEPPTRHIHLLGLDHAVYEAEGESWVDMIKVCAMLDMDITTAMAAVFAQGIQDHSRFIAVNHVMKGWTLNEKMLYGWIFLLPYDSPVLRAYRIEAARAFGKDAAVADALFSNQPHAN